VEPREESLNGIPLSFWLVDVLLSQFSPPTTPCGYTPEAMLNACPCPRPRSCLYALLTRAGTQGALGRSFNTRIGRFANAAGASQASAWQSRDLTGILP
jgi:hypothetical protein